MSVGYIYKLKNSSRIVYVGQASSDKCLSQRLRSHKHDKVFDGFDVEECDLSELNLREAELILRHKPVYNKSLPIKTAFKTKTQINKMILEMVYKTSIYKRVISNSFSIGRCEYFAPEAIEELISNIESRLHE